MLSLRRATFKDVGHHYIDAISIHALLAESDTGTDSTDCQPCISIHALLAESDGRRGIQRHRDGNFYPRSPCGERLADVGVAAGGSIISIHALLAESDRWKLPCTPWRIFLSTLSLRRATSRRNIQARKADNFYPRSPCGERRPAEWRQSVPPQFLSTLSLRRATINGLRHR